MGETITLAGMLVLLRILTAHIFADFFLQRYKWIVGKRTGISSPYLYYHVGIVGILTYLFLADWTHWQLPLFIMVTHFLIDWWKSTQKSCVRNFIIDQALHFLMLLIAWLAYIGFSFTDTLAWAGAILNWPAFWILLISYLLALRPVGFLIGKATHNWRKELEKLPSTFDGLTDAGTWIGYLERIIIVTLVLISQYSAIGFLITAKSVFRYSGKFGDEEMHKRAEYILIGTLMSFLLAIAIGLIARYFLRY